MGITGAIIGAAAIGAGGTYMAGQAQKEGMEAAAKATKRGQDIQYRMWKESQEMMKPYYELGTRTIPKYETTLGIETSPLYQWELSEGQKAIDMMLAKRGLFKSGAALETHRRFIQELGAKYGHEAYQKYLDAIKIGTGAAGSAGLWATQTGAGLAAGYGQQAQIAAAQGTAGAQMWSGVAGIPMSALGTYMNYEMMNRLSPSSSSPYTSGGGLSGGAGGNYTGGAAANVSYIPAGWTGFK